MDIYRPSSTHQGGNAVAVSFISVAVLVFLSALVAFGMWGCPQYKVYEQTKHGQAMLAHAQSTREISVAEAKAKMESAELLSQAEVTRARGVAQANQIIGQSLKDN